MTTERDLIQRLADALTNAIRVIHNEDGTQHISTATPVLTEARTVLSQPEPEGLTNDELEILADDYMFMDGADGTMHLQHIDFAHAAIAADRARWGRTTTTDQES